MRRDFKMLDTNTLRKVSVDEQAGLSGRGEVAFREVFKHLPVPQLNTRDGGVEENLPMERAPDFRAKLRRYARLADQA